MGFLAKIGNAATDLVMNTVGDALLSILGMDNFRTIFSQDETGSDGIRQYTSEPTDRGKWAGTIDKSRPDYYFILKGPQNMKLYGINIPFLNGIQRSIQIPFNVSPQRESISEPIASTITHTQGGGKIRESEGMISKDIVISGQTGLYPKPGVSRSSGLGSGLEQLKYLETCFRRYAFMTRYSDIGKDIQLIYVSRRRQEAWVVEPKNFTSEDATDHNFSWNYTITLEALYPYDGTDAKGLAEGLLSAVPFYSNISTGLQCLGESVDQLYAAANQLSAVYRGFYNTIMQPLMKVANAYADFKSGKIPTLRQIQRSALKDIYKNMTELEDVLVRSEADKKLIKKVHDSRKHIAKVILDDKAFDASFNDKAKQISDLQINVVTTFSDPIGNPVSAIEAIAKNATKTQPTTQQLYTTGNKSPASVKGSASYAQKVFEQNYKISTKNPSSPGTSVNDLLFAQGNCSITRSKGVPLNSETITPPKTADKNYQRNWAKTHQSSIKKVDPSNADYRIAIIGDGDSIQTLSSKLLGDPGRWLDLAILNNLRYPYVASKDYITRKGLTNVLGYGDNILYPVQKSTNSAMPRRVWRNESNESLSLSSLERSFGCDIKIDKDTRDIVFGSNDLALSYGIDNIDQFIRKRILLKKGQLRRAISLGFSSMIGQKEVKEELIRAEARGLFKDDDRITSCQVIELVLYPPVLLLTLAVFVKDMQNPIIVKEKIAS